MFIYVRGRKSERISESESVGGCFGAREGELKSARTCVTYVFVYPCMLCLRQYKRQRGFCCNVHLSVSADLFLLCFQLKQRCQWKLLIFDERMHQTLNLHP